MKKNKMMRLASGLLVAVLITTSTISGTFAKYVTADSATDSARVAKWGVTVEVTGDDAFGTKYDDAVAAEGTKVVSSNGDNVLAPGTKGILMKAKVSGQPEVKVKVTGKVDLVLTNWEKAYDFDIQNDGTKETGTTYCPVIISVNGTDYKVGENGITNTAELETAVEEAIQKIIVGADATIDGITATKEYAANTDFTTAQNEANVLWRWDFGAAGEPITDADINDTALGNLAAADTATAPTIELTTSVFVEQID